MEQSPSEDANCSHLVKCLALYRTCRIYKSPPLVPILSQINAVHMLLSCCFKVHSVVGHCRTLFVAARSKKWVCGRLFTEIAGSNPAWGIDIFCQYCPCCRVKDSAMGRSLFQRSPSECAVSECDFEISTMSRPRPARAVEP